MEPKLHRRVQRYGWDKAVQDCVNSVREYRNGNGSAIPGEFVFLLAYK